MKRLFDIVASSIALIIISPALLLISIAICVTTTGPIFYLQTRIGKHRKEFRMIKFRSMIADADKKGSLISISGDNRITLIGKILRRTKLDELPQLLNVLIGDMSLVGPRPEVPQYIDHYKPKWENIFSVKPGITDIATLAFLNEEACLSSALDHERAYIEVILPIKMTLAMKYVDSHSFWVDIKLILLTIWAITLGRLFAKPDSQLIISAKEKIQNFEKQQP